MLLKPATVAAGLLTASAANAFLLPPEVSENDVKIADAIGVNTPNTAETQTVNLNCPGCPVTINGPRGSKVIQGKPNHLELKFSVAHGAEADALYLNGYRLYPNPEPLHDVLIAPQVMDWKPWRGKWKGWGHHNKDGDDDDHEHQHRRHRGPPGPPGMFSIEPQPLGFAMNTARAAKDTDSQLELVTVDFQIIEVGNQFIEGIPELHVKLIQDPTGRLMIGNIESTVPAPKTEASKDVAKECTTLLCKWLTAIFPSGPRKPCHGNGPAADPSGHGVPVMGGHHGHHGHHGGPPGWVGMHHNPGPGGPEHSWGQLFKNIASHILLPVAIGIVAGVSVSLIGMAVGTLIVTLWRALVRRPSHTRQHHRRHHSGHHHKATHKETAVDEEKSGLIEHQDPPPAYDEAQDGAKKADAEA
jgi:hypothetical protein